MFLRSKLRQSHAIVFAVFQTVFLRCFGVAFHPLAPTLVKENVFNIYIYMYINIMILFTSPKEFQDVGTYKIILSQKTFVSVSQTPFAISTSVFRGSESSII